MKCLSVSSSRLISKYSYCLFLSRKLCHHRVNGDTFGVGSEIFDKPLKEMGSSWDFCSDERSEVHGHGGSARERFNGRWGFVHKAREDATMVFQLLQQDGPGFDTRSALDDLNLNLSGLLVREVLLKIITNLNNAGKSRCAKLGYKFFVWSGEQRNHLHTVNAYHLMMKIFADCEEFKSMWKLVDEMIEKGFPITGRTFNILISTCRDAGLARKVVEMFIKSKTFVYRPFKHSYNAILYSLLGLDHYNLIEWVYQQMLTEGHSPDILTYNVVLIAKYRLGKLDQFHRLLNEMGRDGHSPDLHTYNILLHVIGKGDKPIAALNLLNHMKRIGFDPSVHQYTTLIDGLSRAGNIEACEFFFNEMMKNGCVADVVCYTVMITGYVVAEEIEKAQAMFDEMIEKGQLPNVFTYNAMIRGFCVVHKFDEAFCLLEEMERRGCDPNFLVYNTLVNNLRKAGKLYEAHRVVKQMVEKGRYTHLLFKIKGYKRFL